MFQHRKLVFVLMLYIDMPDDPISILIDQFLYRFSTYSQKIKKLKI